MWSKGPDIIAGSVIQILRLLFLFLANEWEELSGKEGKLRSGRCSTMAKKLDQANSHSSFVFKKGWLQLYKRFQLPT